MPTTRTPLVPPRRNPCPSKYHLSRTSADAVPKLNIIQLLSGVSDERGVKYFWNSPSGRYVDELSPCGGGYWSLVSQGHRKYEGESFLETIVNL